MYTKSLKDRRNWGTYFFYLIWAREISPRSGQIEDPPWPGAVLPIYESICQRKYCCYTSDIRMSGHNIFYIWDFFHIQGAALVKPAIDLSNKVSCYTSDIRRQRSRIVSSIWDVFHLLSAALVKPGLSLIFYLKFLPSLQGFIRKSSNGSNPANTTFTRCFCIFWPGTPQTVFVA